MNRWPAVPVENLSAELRQDGKLVGRGECHLAMVDGEPRGGTVSRLRWTASEPDLTGGSLVLEFEGGRSLMIRITRHSHPEGRTVLRFTVPEPRK